MKGQVRINEMFAFILLDEDNTEGIPAFNAGGLAMPLVGADMARIDSLRHIAESLARDTNKKITLAKFSHREDLEVIEPNHGKHD